MKKTLHSMKFVFTKKAAENETATRASFCVAYILVNRGNPFSDGDLIRKCLNDIEKKCVRKK